MLGRLAKWLRLLGYDTSYFNRIHDSKLIDTAESEGRIILTRDTRLILRKRCRNYIFTRDDRWREQLQQIYFEAGLNTDRALTLCAVCNRRLQMVEKNTIKELVPPYVFETQQDFAVCTGCSRVFWEATHAKKIFAELERLVKEPRHEP